MILCSQSLGEFMARPKSINSNSSILEYALRHLEQERDEIQNKIDSVLAQAGWKDCRCGCDRCRRGCSFFRWSGTQEARAERRRPQENRRCAEEALGGAPQGAGSGQTQGSGQSRRQERITFALLCSGPFVNPPIVSLNDFGQRASGCNRSFPKKYSFISQTPDKIHVMTDNDFRLG